jgi:hypothetical protein
MTENEIKVGTILMTKDSRWVPFRTETVERETKTTWVTKSGVVIRKKDMTTGHGFDSMSWFVPTEKDIQDRSRYIRIQTVKKGAANPQAMEQLSDEDLATVYNILKYALAAVKEI